MNPDSMVVLLGFMALVVVIFRLMIRRPAGMSTSDPPGLRTIVLFSGDAAEFFAEDDPDELLVGVHLFRLLREGLQTAGTLVHEHGTLQNAQCVTCGVGQERVSLVLERIDDRWLLSIEWMPTRRAELRHIRLTNQVYSPADSPELRVLLAAVDHWLHDETRIGQIAWHRRQDWVAEDLSDSSDRPLADR